MNLHTSLTERLHRLAFPQSPAAMPVDFELGYREPLAIPKSEPAAAAATTITVEPSPPEIAPPPRALGAEVNELVQPVRDYLKGFVISEQHDDFERGYFNPLDTSRPAGPEQSREALVFEERRTRLLTSLQTFADSVAQFLADHRSWRVDALREEHTTAWKAAREQQVIVDAVAAEATESMATLRKLKGELSQARLLASGHAARQPDLDSLPSQADLDRWRNQDALLRASLNTAEAALTAHLELRRELGRKLERETNKLTALRKSESELRARLQGKGASASGLEAEPEL